MDQTNVSKPSKTKQLASQLGLLPSKRKSALEDVRQRRPSKRRKDQQLLSYLIVIDFESTCWENKKGLQEIIEFPAVLLDLSTGIIVDEFHHYVMPTECPTLSKFCKQLTGISQTQVDCGIPLPTCLYLFNQWICKLKEEVGVVLMEPECTYREGETLCAIVTWSDWDMGVCLNHECNRKQIKKAAFFNQWIDIRALYRTFYDRRPSGLCGALEDLGVLFTGRQHSGIDDARNTAKLCYRMVCDGCRLTITKCIHKTTKSHITPSSSRTKLLQSNVTNIGKDDLRSVVLNTSSKSIDRNMSHKHSIGPPKLHTGPVEADKSEDCKPSEINDLDDIGSEFFKDVADEIATWERNLGSSENEVGIKYLVSKDNSISSRTCKPVTAISNPVNQLSSAALPCKNATSLRKSPVIAHVSPITLLSPHGVETNLPAKGFYGANKESLMSEGSKVSKLSSDVLAFRQKNCASDENVNITSSFSELKEPKLQSFNYCTENQQDPNISASNCELNGVLDCDVVQETPPVEHLAFRKPLNSCFSDKNNNLGPSTSSSSVSDDFKIPNTIQWLRLKHLATKYSPRNTRPMNSTNFDSSPLVSSGGKITPPLCGCGKRAKRKVVCTPGPAEGKPFYVCPNSRGSNHKLGCDYFKWELNTSDYSNIAKPLLPEYGE